MFAAAKFACRYCWDDDPECTHCAADIVACDPVTKRYEDGACRALRRAAHSAGLPVSRMNCKTTSCANPVYLKATGIFVGCYKCIACRNEREEAWMNRCECEVKFGGTQNSFVTLTKDPKEFPDERSLDPVEDHSKFIKRLRTYLPEYVKEMKYFHKGEYSDKFKKGLSDFPHGHLHYIFFGIPPCRKLGTRYAADGRTPVCCDICLAVSKAWGKGRVECKPVDGGTPRYIVGYLSDGLWLKGDPRLGDLHPEYFRMSKGYGKTIGISAVPHLVAIMRRLNWVARTGDVIDRLKFGGRSVRIGKFIRRKLREAMGLDAGAPPEVLARMRAMTDLCRLKAIALRRNTRDVVAEEGAETRRRLMARLACREKGVRQVHMPRPRPSARM